MISNTVGNGFWLEKRGEVEIQGMYNCSVGNAADSSLTRITRLGCGKLERHRCSSGGAAISLRNTSE